MLENILTRNLNKILLSTLVGTSLSLSNSESSEMKPYVHLDIGFTVLGKPYGLVYDSGMSYGVGFGKGNNSKNVDIGITYFESGAGITSSSSQGFLSVSQSKLSRNLSITGIHANLSAGNDDFYFGAGALYENVRFSENFFKMKRGIFVRSDTLSIQPVNRPYLGYNLFGGFKIKQWDGMTLHVQVESERTYHGKESSNKASIKLIGRLTDKKKN